MGKIIETFVRPLDYGDGYRTPRKLLTQSGLFYPPGLLSEVEKYHDDLFKKYGEGSVEVKYHLIQAEPLFDSPLVLTSQVYEQARALGVISPDICQIINGLTSDKVCWETSAVGIVSESLAIIRRDSDLGYLTHNDSWLPESIFLFLAPT